MKYLILLCSSVLIFGCTRISPPVNQFSSQSDTLIITTKKLKGTGLFRIGAAGKTFRDTTEWKNLEWFEFYPDYQIIYPDNIKEMLLSFQILMFDSLKYYDLETGNVYKQQNYGINDREMLMIKGIKNDEEVFIVDENHNSDFRDDSVRRFQKWDWYSDENLIPCVYYINTGNEEYIDTGWLKIGFWDNHMLYITSQHLIADITIENLTYTIGVADYNATSFCFFKPIMYPFAENSIERDTFLLKDIVELGDYIKLGEYHYKFDRLYNGSGTIVLIREPEFNNLTGTQAGMKHPEFKCLTTKGDTLLSENLIKDKPLLVANISGCTPSSYTVFKDLNTACDLSLNILGLDSGVANDLEVILADVEMDYNKDIYNNYRKAYSSYDCYLIDTTGRVLDKFSIFDWETNLSEYITKNSI